MIPGDDLNSIHRIGMRYREEWLFLFIKLNIPIAK